MENEKTKPKAEVWLGHRLWNTNRDYLFGFFGGGQHTYTLQIDGKYVAGETSPIPTLEYGQTDMHAEYVAQKFAAILKSKGISEYRLGHAVRRRITTPDHEIQHVGFMRNSSVADFTRTLDSILMDD